MRSSTAGVRGRPDGVPTVAELVRLRRRGQWLELILGAQAALGVVLLAALWFGRPYGAVGLLVPAAGTLPWLVGVVAMAWVRASHGLGPALRRAVRRTALRRALCAPFHWGALVVPLLLARGTGWGAAAMVPGALLLVAPIASFPVAAFLARRARAALLEGRFDEGLAGLGHPAWRLFPDLRDGWRAQLLVQRGDLVEAREVAGRVTSLPELTAASLLARVALLREAGTPDEALAAAAEAVREVPLSVPANAALAELELARGLDADALERLEWALDTERRAVGTDERAAVLQAARAWAWAVVGRSAEAREAIARVPWPTSPVRRGEVALRLHRAWIALGDGAEAEAVRRSAAGLPGQAARLLARG